MVPLRHPFVRQQKQRRQHQDDGGDAQHDALGHDKADVLAQRKAHEAQGQEAGDGRQRTARQGAERGLHGCRHGILVVLEPGLFLLVGVVQEHGIVHGDAQLQHRRDGLRNVGDLSHQEVRAEVVDDGKADVDEQHEGQDPGFHGEGHGDERQQHGQAYKQGHLLVHQLPGILHHDGEARQEALFVAEAADLLDGVHGLIRRTGMLVLDDHHGAVPGVEHIAVLLRNEFRGDLHAHHVGEPHGVGYTRHLLDLLRQFVGIARRHVLHDQHGSRRHVERLFQQIHAVGGIQIRGQIGQNIVVDRRRDIGDHRGHQQCQGDKDDDGRLSC